MNTTLKQGLLLFLAILNLNLAIGQFVDNGINYNITGPTTVEVIANSPIYSGVIDIPLTATNPSTSITYNVTAIASNAFYNCNGLTSITLANSVTSIGASAFYICSSLTDVTLGNSMTSIGASAFGNCANLNSVIVPVTDPLSIALGANVFFLSPTTGSATLTVPLGSETAYSGAPQWAAFGPIVGVGTLGVDDYVLESFFNVYPNPLENTLFIKQKTAQKLENIRIYSILGKEVLNSNNNTIDVSGLLTGLYVLQIFTIDGSAIKIIVKK